MPHACGIDRQRGKEILVDRIALAVDAFLLGHFQFKPPALFDGVRQFAKAVGEFHAAGIELEALGDAAVLRRPCQRRLPGRILIENGRPADAEMAFDLFHQHAAENIPPAIVIADTNAGRPRRAGKAARDPARRSAASPGDRCRQSG